MPRDYAKLSPRLWTGRLGRALRGDLLCQALAPYLIANFHSTMTGLYRLPLMYIASDLGQPADAIERGLEKLQQNDFVTWDPELELVFVRDNLRIELAKELEKSGRLNPKDNKVAGVRRQVEQFAESFLYEAFYELYSEVLGVIPEPMGSPFEGSERAGQVDSKGASKGLEGSKEDVSQPLRSPLQAPSKVPSSSGKETLTGSSQVPLKPL